MLEEQKLLLKKQLEQLAELLNQGDAHRAFLLIKTIEKQLSPLAKDETTNKNLAPIRSSMREYRKQYRQLSGVSSYLYSTYAEIGRVSAAAQLLRQGAILFFAGLMLLGFDFSVTPMLSELMVTVVMACVVALCQLVSERHTAKVTTAVSLGIIGYTAYQDPLTSGLEVLSIVGMMGWERWFGTPLPLAAKAILMALQRHFVSPVLRSSTHFEPDDSTAISATTPALSRSAHLASNPSSTLSVSSATTMPKLSGKLIVLADWNHANVTWHLKMFQRVMEACKNCTLIVEGECSNVKISDTLSMYYNCVEPKRYSMTLANASCFFFTPSHDIRGMDSSFPRYEPRNPSIEQYRFFGDVTQCIGTVAFRNREEYNIKVNDFINMTDKILDLTLEFENLCRDVTKTSICALTDKAILDVRHVLKLHDSDHLGRIVEIVEDTYQKGILSSVQKMIGADIENHSRLFDFLYLKAAILESIKKMNNIYDEIIGLLKVEGDKAAIKAIQSTMRSLKQGSPHFFRMGAAHLQEGQALTHYLQKIQEKMPVVLLDVDSNKEQPFKPLSAKP